MIAALLLVLSLTPEARREVEAAIQSQLARDFATAITSYASVLHRHPEFVPARLYRSEALWLSGRRHEARRELSTVYAEHPDLLAVKWIRWRIGEASSEDEALLRRLENVYSFEQQGFVATGTPCLVLLSLGEVELAVDDFRRVSALDPDDVKLHRQLGLAFSKARVAVAAAEAFERVVAVDPPDVGAWKQLGSSYLVLQRWHSAIDAFERVLDREGDVVAVLLAQGYAHERLTHFEEALDRYRKAARLAPDASQPQFRLGRAFLAQHELGQAERALKKASELDPGAAEPLGFLGELYLKKSEPEKAIELLEKATTIDPGYFEAYYQLAQAYHRTGRTAEAKEAIETYEKLKAEQRGAPRKP